MALVVQKYGGSSLADLERLGAVAGAVAARHQAGETLVVVVSAMGKTTEGLLGLARQAAAPRVHFEPPRRELDMLVSTGERVSMALLSIALQARGVPAVSFTGSQSGIFTSDRHFDARIVEVRPARIQRELEHGKVVIVAGYQGMSARREITTLGRGGSDTTAVALAATLGAERCEIYSDVDGVYSADPHRVPGARHLPSIDYETMHEMAEAGARVLNVHAVDWAKRHALPLLCRRTAELAGTGAGRETRVERAESGARAIVVNPALQLLYGPETAREALRAAALELDAPFREAPVETTPAFASSGKTLLARVPVAGLPDPVAARRAFERVAGVSVVEDYAELSLIGASAAASVHEARALATLGFTPHLLTRSPRRLSLVVPLESLAAAELALHRVWVEDGAGSALATPARRHALGGFAVTTRQELVIGAKA